MALRPSSGPRPPASSDRAPTTRRRRRAPRGERGTSTSSSRRPGGRGGGAAGACPGGRSSTPPPPSPRPGARSGCGARRPGRRWRACTTPPRRSRRGPGPGRRQQWPAAFGSPYPQP
ncbi:hypothetical protein B7486_68215 [cyanobacterium TDX16]|nr:hypothetical protein B7486_68215 [cyanobacterium TDX16]